MKIWSIIGGISAIVALVATLISGYDSLTTDTELADAKKDIIVEMRREVVKNRGAMISIIQQSADDLLWDMQQMDQTTELYKYKLDKHNQLLKQIEELKDEDSP